MGMWTGYAQGLQIRNAREDEERRRRQEQSNRDREFARQRELDAQNQQNRDREFARQRELDAQNQQNRDREFAATQEEREFNRQFKTEEARREQSNADRSFGLALDKAQADVDAQNRRLDMEENNAAWTNAIHEENLLKAMMLNDEQQELFQQRQAKRDADWKNGVDRYANFAMLAMNAQQRTDVPGKGWKGYEARMVDPELVERIAEEQGVDIASVVMLQKPGDPSTRSMYITDSNGRAEVRTAQQIEQDLTSTFGDAEDASRMVYGIGTKEREENRKLSLQHQMRIDERRMDAFDRQRGSVYMELAKGTLTQEEADSVLDAIDERERRVFKRDGAGEPAPSEFESAMQKFAKENPRSVYREGDRWCVKSHNGSCVTVTEQNYKQLIGGGATAVRTTNPSQKVNATPVNSTPKNSPVTNEQQKNTAPVPKVEVENNAVETKSEVAEEPASKKQEQSVRKLDKDTASYRIDIEDLTLDEPDVGDQTTHRLTKKIVGTSDKEDRKKKAYELYGEDVVKRFRETEAGKDVRDEDIVSGRFEEQLNAIGRAIKGNSYESILKKRKDAAETQRRFDEQNAAKQKLQNEIDDNRKKVVENEKQIVKSIRSAYDDLLKKADDFALLNHGKKKGTGVFSGRWGEYEDARAEKFAELVKKYNLEHKWDVDNYRRNKRRFGRYTFKKLIASIYGDDVAKYMPGESGKYEKETTVSKESLAD